MDDLTDETVSDTIDKIRGKFKAGLASLTLGERAGRPSSRRALPRSLSRRLHLELKAPRVVMHIVCDGVCVGARGKGLLELFENAQGLICNA